MHGNKNVVNAIADPPTRLTSLLNVGIDSATNVRIIIIKVLIIIRFTANSKF